MRESCVETARASFERRHRAIFASPSAQETAAIHL